MPFSDYTMLDAVDRWSRCCFPECVKLLRDMLYLYMPLFKKHAAQLQSEEAKCHGSYMMAALDASNRPVPDVLVDHGA